MNGYITPFTSEYIGLADNFKVNPKFCGGNNYFERYIKDGALEEQNRGECVTHVFLKIDDNNQAQDIIGYITLRASSLNIRGHKADFGAFPAIEIMAIAINSNYEKQGFGRMLLNYTINVADKLRRNYTGIEYVITCADGNAVGFYSKCNFNKCIDYYKIPNRQKMKKFMRNVSKPYNVDMYLKLPKLD